MKIEFDAIEVENFKSFGGVTVLDLTSLEYGLHFVRGRNDLNPRLEANGAGKSTFVSDAVAYCLFGKTTNGLRGPDVKPWKHKGRTSVSVTLTIDGKEKVVTRVLKPSLLSVDGKETSQADLETMIGMNYDLFANAVIMGQGQPLFFDMKPEKKMQLFVEALALDRWDARAELASERVRTLERQEVEDEGQIEGLQSGVTELNKLIEEGEAKALEWQQEFNKSMRDMEKELRALEAQKEKVENSAGKADLELEEAETEVRHYEKKLSEQDDVVLDAQRKHAQASVDYQNYNKQILTAEDELKTLGEGDTCKSCGQSLKGTALEKHRRTLNKRINVLYAQHEFADAFKATSQRLEAEQSRRNQIRGWLNEQIDKANAARDALETRTKNLATINAEIKSLRNRRDNESETVNPHQESVRDMKRRRKMLEADIDAIKRDLKLTRQRIERAKFWIKGFKDIRLYVLEDVLQELELTTNAMLDEVGLVDWRVKFVIERETKAKTISRGLSIMIESPESNGPVRWESWSGGEGQRLRIVGALALSEVLLNRVSVECDYEVLDEPTRSISASGVRDLCGYLADRAERLGRRCMLIDHVARESKRFKSVLMFVNDKNGSRLLQQGVSTNDEPMAKDKTERVRVRKS